MDEQQMQGKDGFVKVMPLREYDALMARLKAQQAVVEAARAYREHGGQANMAALFDALDAADG